MKNVLMIAYTDYKFDGRVRREAETLCRSGDFHIQVLSLKDGESARCYKNRGVFVREVNQRKYVGNNKLRYIFEYIAFLARCFAICTWRSIRRKIDIVHVHNMPDFLIMAAMVPKLLGCKLILDIHDSVPETYLSKFPDKQSIMFKLLCLEESVCATLAHRIICVNHAQKKVVVDRGIKQKKVTISMNVPDPSLFPVNGYKNPGWKNNNAFRMVYHGTIAHRLGVDLVVKALSTLSERIPEIEFHLWSKAGLALDEIEQLGKSLKVDKHLHIIPGGVPLEKLASELRVMDIGIIANRKGVATDLMLPVKLLEYISLGIPVVAPRLRCIQYYFSDDMISYFEPENLSSMVNAIIKLYENKERQISQAKAASKFLYKYGWKVHKHELLNMYKNL